MTTKIVPTMNIYLDAGEYTAMEAGKWFFGAMKPTPGTHYLEITLPTTVVEKADFSCGYVYIKQRSEWPHEVS